MFTYALTANAKDMGNPALEIIIAVGRHSREYEVCGAMIPGNGPDENHVSKDLC